jgi:hypothetical protein
VSWKAHFLLEIRSHGNDISRTADVLVLCSVTLRTLTTYSYSGGADKAPADPTARGTHNIHTMELFVTPVMRPWNNFADNKGHSDQLSVLLIFSHGHSASTRRHR